MKKSSIYIQGTIATVSLVISIESKAEMFSDTQTTITLRNFYMLRDYNQDNANQSQAGSWSQAVIARLNSGYTEGTIGFGIDVTGFSALKLDGGSGTSNDGSLPYSADTGSPASEFGRGGATAKLRFSKNTLKIGLLEPRLPVIFQDDVRIIPQTFEGVLFESTEFARLKLTAGQLWNTSTRASSNKESFYLAGHSASEDSNKLNFAGGDVRWTANLAGSYYFANLEDIYDQHYLGGTLNFPIVEKVEMFGTLSYFHNEESGKALSGTIDNSAYGIRLGVRRNGQSLSVSYQRMLGNDMFPMLMGSTPQPFLVNWVTNGGFFWAEERSYQVRYDYDFADAGLPGLTFMSRYTKGTDINYGGTKAGHEFERNTDIGYTFQEGGLKNLSLLLRTSTVRSSYSNDYNEIRFITTMPLAF